MRGMNKYAALLIGLAMLTAAGCSKSGPVTMAQFPDIDTAAVLEHTKVLSSDKFEGRAPGTMGEELTVSYLVDQFKKVGLKPGNTDGTYIQKVPLVGITPTPAPLVFTKGKQQLTLKWKDDVVAWTKQVADLVILDKSDLVFVGYGVVAPEYNWDDYKGVDVQGKTGEQFDLVTPDKNMGRASIEGWITRDQTERLFKMAGHDFDALKKQAVTREFKPVPLGVTASMTIRNTLRTIDSRNVVAKIEGSDPALKDDYVIYTAHWDHFGKTAEGIFHGARDNASGTAALLEVGRAFTKISPPPKRSVLLISVTAEEQGLLGSQYYAVTPIYPLAKTVAEINMDELNVTGATRDLTLIGYGASDLDDYASAAASEQGRTVHADAEPEKGYYYRSDHFNFAKMGVPALNPDQGIEYTSKPAEYSQKVRDNWTANVYHTPKDVVTPDWDLTGAAQDLKLLFAVGYRVSQADKFPEWKPGNEFKATRDKMLKR